MKLETEIRNLKRDLTKVRRERDRVTVESRKYKVAAGNARAEVDEWKDRFDRLLERTEKPLFGHFPWP